MDLLYVLSLAGRLRPRLVAAIVACGHLFFSHAATSIFLRVAREKGAEITSLLQRALDPALAGDHHPHQCHDHAHCPR